MKKKIIPWLIILVIGAVTDLGAAEVTNRIVAVINNEIITDYELEKFLKMFKPADLGKSNQEEMKKQVLFQLIDQKLVESQVKKLGIQIPSEEVEKAISRIRHDQGLNSPEEFSAALVKGGMSEAELRIKIKEQLQRIRLISREIGSKIVVPEQKIKDYFQKNKEMYQKSEGVHLGQIVLTVPDNAPVEEKVKQKELAEDIWNRLKRGENFAELARKYSQGSSANQGGDLGQFRWNEIDPELKTVISHLKAGEISNLLPISHGWQIVKVIGLQENKEITFADVRDQIHEKLFQEEIEIRFDQWLKQLKGRSYIQVLL